MLKFQSRDQLNHTVNQPIYIPNLNGYLGLKWKDLFGSSFEKHTFVEKIILIADVKKESKKKPVGRRKHILNKKNVCV